MKYIFSILSLLFCLHHSYAQVPESNYRLYGEITTVENQVLKGFITWGVNKNYWVDFFEASKIQNPYATYFNSSDEIVFKQNGETFARPGTHVFCCRFGNIRSIRLTGENEIQLELKNSKTVRLIKKNLPDIGQTIQITTSQETIKIPWEYISEIHFMQAAPDLIAPEINTVAGIVKSSQGIYKGIINYNCNRKLNNQKIQATNILLNKMKKISREKGTLKVLPQDHLFQNPVRIKTDALYPLEDIMIIMPNVGSVIVPSNQFREMEVIPLQDLALLSYEDFKVPVELKGIVYTRNNEKLDGTLAYDLDENYDFEVLDGKNNGITYRIPFKYISSIEPKNYKYSFITLLNESHLSLGEGPDVNEENSGIIVWSTNEIPIYITWEEVKKVQFN